MTSPKVTLVKTTETTSIPSFEISIPTPAVVNLPSDNAHAEQIEHSKASSIEIQTSPPIVVNIPPDSVAVVTLGLICFLVWMVKPPTS